MNQYFAVMGNPIAHSLSPQIHQHFAKQTGIVLHYEKIEVSDKSFEHDVANFFKQGGSGLNITAPFKERAYTIAEVKTLRCQKAGAANTLWQINGILHADNTDGIGLMRDLNRYIQINGNRVLLLGAGGAARGVLGELLGANPKILTLSNRSMEKARVLAQQFSNINLQAFHELTPDYDLIINATSINLNQQSLFLPHPILSNSPFCYDLSYNPVGPTHYMQWATSHGSPTASGIGMLIEQAAEAYFIWHGVRVNNTVNELLRRFRAPTEL